ncbi:MAG: rhodanese-like domain-containing protein [Candidatus Nucleicultricaceae bacterium]
MLSNFEITPEELHRSITENDTNMNILDVRSAEEFSICALSHSKNIPLDTLQRQLDALDPDACYVVLCHHGVRSLQACLLMHQKGFTNVKSLKGGIDAWSRCIDSSLPLY